MTIGGGVVCADGIVIGADRRVTNLEQYTFEEEKVHAIAWQNGAAIWTYAGNADTVKNLRSEIQSRFAPYSVIGRSELKERLQGSLRACLKKGQRFAVLFGAQTQGERNVLLVANGTDNPMEVQKCEIIGTGDSSLSRYLRGIFLSLPFPPMMPQAIVNATYLIQQAKRYDGEYCGGETDVYTLDFAGNTRVIDQWQTERWGKHLQLLEFETAVLFATLTTKGIEEDGIEKRLQNYAEIVRSFCAKVRGE
jgi:hypothetical protein